MAWLASLATGLGVGVIYGLLSVRSPAPPMIALLGLLGILGGEQLVGLARSHWRPPVAIETPRPPLGG